MKHYPHLVTVLALSLASCSGHTDESTTPATDLSRSIDTAIEGGRYDEALLLIDTLNVRYKDSLDLRRAAIGQRARAVEGITLKAIPQADATLAAARAAVDSMATMFTTVKVSPSLPPYYVPTSIKGQSVAVQPRVSDDDMPWMLVVSGVAGKNQSLVLIDGSGNRVATSTAAELPVIVTEEADTIGSTLAAAVDLNGYKLSVGGHTLSLSPTLSRAIALSWQYVQARKQLRQALMDREALERRLMTARTQAATATPVATPTPGMEAAPESHPASIN